MTCFFFTLLRIFLYVDRCFFFYITSDFSLHWQSDPWICTLVDDKRKNRASKGNFPKNSKSEQNAHVRYGSKTSRRWSAFGRCSRTFCYTQNGTKNTFVLVLLVSLDAVFSATLFHCLLEWVYKLRFILYFLCSLLQSFNTLMMFSTR